MAGRKYTPEQKAWLITHLQGFDTYADCTEAFNTAFSESRSQAQIQDQCIKQLHICIGKNAGRYANGSRARALPIGTIRKSRTATYIKVADTLNGFTGYARPDWIPLQEKIYTQVYGKQPDGTMICFLDCNPNNFSLCNLYPVTRKIAVIMAKNKWWSTNPDITRAGIVWSNLWYAIKEAR